MRRARARRWAVLGTFLLLLASTAAACGSSYPTSSRRSTRSTSQNASKASPSTSRLPGGSSRGQGAGGSGGSSGGSGSGGGPGGRTSTGTIPGREGVPAFSHVFVVVMENLSEQAALATTSISVLAQRYAWATSWYAVSHPSLPNYLALISGSTWGITSDCTSCYIDGPNLATQLQGAGISWGAYFESMPGTCFTGPQSSDGSYAQKHEPFIYFGDVRNQPALCNNLQPLTTLMPLLKGSASSVPRFVWVTPDMCDDGHDCSASTAGNWLTGFVGAVTSSSAWADGGVLIVTWDESDDSDTAGVDTNTGAVTSSGGGGNVLTIVVAPGIGAGTQFREPLDHYSLLRTVEDAFGLPLLGEAASPGTRPISGIWPSSSFTASS